MPGSRRDGTQILAQVLLEAVAGKRVPLWTRDGLYFRLRTNTGTLKQALEELQGRGLVKGVRIPSGNGGEVEGIEITPVGEQVARDGIALLHVFCELAR